MTAGVGEGPPPLGVAHGAHTPWDLMGMTSLCRGTHPVPWLLPAMGGGHKPPRGGASGWASPPAVPRAEDPPLRRDPVESLLQ